MDPAKCLEILGNRGTCGGSHDAHHGHTDPTASQAAAEAAAATTAACGSGGGGGQVINLATGANETRAASEAASGLLATMGVDSSSSSNAEVQPSGSAGGAADSQTPSPTTAPYAENEDLGRRESSTFPSGDTSRETSGGPEDGGIGEVNGRAPGQKDSAAAAKAAEEGQVLKGMEGMSAGALVTSFRRAQEERVALYRKFNGGLKEALRSGDYSGYPALCCEVTAGFSVLSKAINAIQTRLDAEAETKPLAGIIRRVQGHEQEKLTVTAAHHLESMREARALGMGPGMTAYAGGGGAGSGSVAQDRLLSDGVGDLLRRVEGEAAAVTELLEELRYEAEGLE